MDNSNLTMGSCVQKRSLLFEKHRFQQRFKFKYVSRRYQIFFLFICKQMICYLMPLPNQVGILLNFRRKPKHYLPHLVEQCLRHINRDPNYTKGTYSDDRRVQREAIDSTWVKAAKTVLNTNRTQQLRQPGRYGWPSYDEHSLNTVLCAVWYHQL